MSKRFLDYDDGDFAFSISDNMAMDIDSGDIHFILQWYSKFVTTCSNNIL